MSSIQRIRETFHRMGYPSGSYIQQAAFYNVLDQINGSVFDRAVAHEIWDQVSMGTNRDARIEEVCDIIAEAERILRGKIQETERDMNDLALQKRRVEQAPISVREKEIELRRLDYQLGEARKDLAEYEDDLRHVSIPFHPHVPNVSHYSQNSSYIPHLQPGQPHRLSNNSLDPSFPHRVSNMPITTSQIPPLYTAGGHMNNSQNIHNSQYPIEQKLEYFDGSMVSTASVNQDLKIVLWIAIALGVLQIIIMYKKFDFLNMLIIVTLLSIFLLDYFDSTYIKVCVALIVFSIILDIVWLCMYAATFWSPPLVSEHSQGEVVYLRFIVLFTLIILVIKMPLAILLLKYRDVAANTNFTVPVYGKTQLNVVANRGNNLISQGCGNLPIFSI